MSIIGFLLKTNLRSNASFNLTVSAVEFASMYFEKYNKSKETPWENKIILKVPHPSRGQWAFINNHKDELDKLERLFKSI